MAAIKISELERFQQDFLTNHADEIIIPASHSDKDTGTINLHMLLHDLVETSEHEISQNDAITTNRQNISNLSTEVGTFIETQHETDQQQNTKIENIENIDVWDKETFHD